MISLETQPGESWPTIAQESFSEKQGGSGTGVSFSPTQTIGARGDGLKIGNFAFNEFFSENTKQFRVYSFAIKKIPIVSASIRYYLNMCAQAKWRLIPAGGEETPTPEARRLCDLIAEMLFDSSRFNFQELVKRCAAYKFWGFSVHEWTAIERDDGLLGFLEIAPRAQSTLGRWQRDERNQITGVYQNHKDFIPREKIVYLVDNALHDSPEGLGLLKSVEETVERLYLYHQLEEAGLSCDLRGVLTVGAPLREIQDMIKRGNLTAEEAERIVAPLKSFTRKYDGRKRQALFYDTEPYSSTDNMGRVTNVPKFQASILQGNSSSLPEANTIIQRLHREIARALGAEFLFMGEDPGSRALATEMTSQFSLMVDEGLAALRQAFQSDLVLRLCDLNGFDADIAPQLVVEKAKFLSVTERINGLERLSGGQIDANDAAVPVLRAELGLPIKPEGDAK